MAKGGLGTSSLGESGSLLEVEAGAVGYSTIFDALSDMEGFCREWLGRPLPDEKRFEDMSQEVTKEWGREHHGRPRRSAGDRPA